MNGYQEKEHEVVILMAEDDPDDRLLTEQALEESHLVNTFKTVENGEELLEYLCRKGRYADPKTSPRPGVILLDLNMPRMDGREALQEIKKHPDLRTIPVIVLTTSSGEDDIASSYSLGASSYITKPVTFTNLVTVMSALGHYWFKIVELPPT